MITMTCPACLGEGGELASHPNDPYPKYLGPCLTCHGTGEVEVETFPVECEDLVPLMPKDTE